MKKIITFLGTGAYKETTYSYADKSTGEEISVTTRFIQEAVHKIVGGNSVLYVALTNGAKETNWLDKGENKGLRTVLESKEIPYREVLLADGKNEEQMWSNFEAIFDILEEGDQVYIDVTHSFRSIPIIIMSVINYAKFIKNITINAIYYGAFDATVDGITPIFDLSLFNIITDWTIGAEKFINAGDSESITKIMEKTVGSILRDTKGASEEAQICKTINKNLKAFSDALYTVRGDEISKVGGQLKGSLELIKKIEENHVLKPFEKILEKIYEKVHFYTNFGSSENFQYKVNIVRDIHDTVKLCRDLNLIQQAYTLLLENIINYLCIVGDLDLLNREIRETVSKVILYYHPMKDIILDDKCKEIHEKIKNYLNEDIAILYNDLGDYRNDFNHAGLREHSRKAKTFKENLNEYIDKFEKTVVIEIVGQQ